MKPCTLERIRPGQVYRVEEAAKLTRLYGNKYGLSPSAIRSWHNIIKDGKRLLPRIEDSPKVLKFYGRDLIVAHRRAGNG